MQKKEAAKAKIKGANADVVEVIFDKAGNATVITKDGKVYTIVGKDIFKQRSSTDNGSSANAGQITSGQANARKAAKEIAKYRYSRFYCSYGSSSRKCITWSWSCRSSS